MKSQDLFIKSVKKTFFVELDIAITYSHRCALKPFMEHFLVTHLFFTEDWNVEYLPSKLLKGSFQQAMFFEKFSLIGDLMCSKYPNGELL